VRPIRLNKVNYLNVLSLEIAKVVLQLTNMHFETIAVTSGRPPVNIDGPVNTPICLNSTFHAGGPIGYGRTGNETWLSLETTISALEGGKTLAFSSGMAAASAVFELLPIGAKICVSNQGYSGVLAILQQYHSSGRLNVHFVNIANTIEAMASLVDASMIWIESPTNPNLDVAELPQLISNSKKLGVLVAVDNTFATPLIQQPLIMGADIVMHSATKYFSGHSDVLMGSLSTNDDNIFSRLSNVRLLHGAIPGPFEAWLVLRGIRTFPLRFQRSQDNAMEIATRLSTHPLVARVRYPGLTTHPQHDIAKSFMKGFGAIVSFEIIEDDADVADRVCQSSRLIVYATSLGGVESLWERRRRWPAESNLVPDSLIRLSVGCEHVDDIWNDIKQSLDACLK